MNLIVVVDQSWGIGKDGDQLLYIPADLKHFKALTAGHAVILGRKTLATFPGGKPLPKRRNLILSTQVGYTVENGEVFPDLERLRAAAPSDAFVIGGERVYRELLPDCDTAYVTKVEAVFPADRHFPNLDTDPAWQCIETEGPFFHEGIPFSYCLYHRI